MSAHGYGPYSNGCRCDVCRKAKADYMRERRAAARALAQEHTTKRATADAFKPGAVRHLARVEQHGTRFAYEEKGCRCRECTTARVDMDIRYRNAKKGSTS